MNKIIAASIAMVIMPADFTLIELRKMETPFLANLDAENPEEHNYASEHTD